MRSSTTVALQPCGDEMASFKERAPVQAGVVEDAAPGCAWLDARTPGAGWALAVESFDEADFGLERGDALPDLSLDPEDRVLTLLNASDTAKAYHVSVRDRTLIASNDQVLSARPCRGRRCTTLSIAVGPRTRVDVAHVSDEVDIREVDIASDIVDIVEPPSTASRTYSVFPLPSQGGPWLCTQAAGGLLSHYPHASTFYALDFRCPVGTPALAIADGVVEAVDVANEGGGVHVSELFKWNSVSLRLDDGFYAEYVHLASSSLAVGDRVAAGAVVGLTGAVGFCPEPHLHIEVHASAAKDAPSVPLCFLVGGRELAPEAGEWWDGYGGSGS